MDGPRHFFDVQDIVCYFKRGPNPKEIKLTDGSSAGVRQDLKTFALNYKWSTPNERLNDWGRTSNGELYQKVLRTGIYNIHCRGLQNPSETVCQHCMDNFSISV